MGFFNDFATGFFTTGAEKVERREKIQEELDMDKLKRIHEVDAQKQLFEHKAKIERELEAQKQKEEEQRRRDLLADVLATAPSPKAPTGTPEVATPLPTAAEQQKRYTEGAARAAILGDDDIHKALKTQADVYKIDREVAQEQQTKARQPVLSVAGTPIAQDYAKAEAERLAKGGSTKFQTTAARMVPGATAPNAQELAIRESNDSALAQSLVADIAESTATEAGVSRLAPQEIINKAEDIVRLKNRMEVPDLSEEAAVTLALELQSKLQELDSYSTGLGQRVLNNIKPSAPKEQSKEQPQSKPEETIPEGTTAINRKTGERMVYKDGAWQPL